MEIRPWEEELLAALAPLGIPYANKGYGGEEETYLVLNGHGVPANFGDDAPQHKRVLIQLHLFTALTHNTIQLVKDIARAVYDAGFTYPEDTDASDEDRQHIVFEFQTVEETGV